MKFQELKENEPLKVIEVSKHIPTPIFDAKNPSYIEFKHIQMEIFTDGVVEKESETTSKNIEEYYIKKRKYDLDTLKTKNIYFKNHSYVITYLIAKEWMKVGHIIGWFDVIKDVSIFLQNSKDKQALKSAKRVIRDIENRNKRADYSSIIGMIASQCGGLKKFEMEEVSKNVYSLKKVKR